MRDGRRDGQQQTCRCGQGRRDGASRHQSDHPVGQLCDFGVGQHDDVVVHRQFVTLPAGGFCLGQHRLVLAVVLVVLDATVAVLVFELQQAGFLPALHPFRAILVLEAGLWSEHVRLGGHDRGIGHERTRLTLHNAHAAVERGMQIQASHAAHGRGHGVQQRDEDQRPASRVAGISHLGHSEEANDHVRQTSRTNHQRDGEEHHVQRRTRRLRGVLGKTQVGHHLIQLGQQRHLGASQVRAQTQHRQRVTRQVQRNEHCRDGVSNDQHDVLGHLRVSDALHAAEHRIGKDNRHTQVDAHVSRHVQEAREGHAHTRHLTHDVHHTDDQQADHRHRACGLRVVAVADELRHGELAELAKVRCQQHRQQHISTRPAHEEHGAAVSHGGQQARHRDERCRRHPVSSGGHAVGDGVNPAASHIELGRATRPRPESNTQVERKAGAHDQVGDGLKIHDVPPFRSVFVHVELTVDLAHLLGVPEDQGNEHVNGPLLTKPEPERITAQVDVVEQGSEDDGGPVGHPRPYRQNDG